MAPIANLLKGNGAQGRNRTTDTVIFSHVLYQLSYLGSRIFGPAARRAERSLTLAFLTVHPGRRTCDAIAFAEPFQQVAVLASAAAEGRMLRARRLAAQRAILGLSRLRHIPPRWRVKHRLATRPRRQSAAPRHPSTRRVCRGRRSPPDARRSSWSRALRMPRA